MFLAKLIGLPTLVIYYPHQHAMSVQYHASKINKKQSLGD